MRGNNNKKLGDVIKQLMKNPKLSEKLDKLNALEAWEEIIGSPIVKYINDQKIHKGVLYVKLNSAVIRNELSYKKTDIISKINQKMGPNFISDIILK